MSRPSTARRPSAQRSAVSNGTRILVGVNGNSAMARRYRDLVESLTNEQGGDLTEGEVLRIRNVATLHLHAEELAARIVRGEPVDPEVLTRAINGAMRALDALGRQKAAKKPGRRSINDVLASRTGS